jgi:subtilisin family serine protease
MGATTTSKPLLNNKLFIAHPISTERPIVIAVIDTGLDIKKFKDKIKLCKFGHKDFTGTGLNDSHGHGTHISGLIEKNTDNAHYCQVIMKYYDPNSLNRDNLINTEKAFRMAINLKVDVINYSGGGTMSSSREKVLVQEALDEGITVVVAAGNERCDMDSGCTYYPAMYDSRIIVVGNLSPKRVPAKSSNYGSIVDVWEFGVDIKSYCINGEFGCKMTGTSQATAIQSGKAVRSIHINRFVDKVLILLRTA